MRNGFPGAPEPQLYTGIICRSATKVKRFVFWTGRDRNCFLMKENQNRIIIPRAD